MQELVRGKRTGGWACAALASVLLAGCGTSEEPTSPASDPAMSGALGEDIMVDPEMAGQAGAALEADEGEVSLPPADRSPEAIRDARAKAEKLVGHPIQPAPEARQGGVNVLTESAATAAQVAKATKLAKTDCTAKLAFSNTWAAKVPTALPVYPRGAVQEAAGVAGEGCAMIVVNYATPIGAGDVVAFYHAMADKAGYSAQVRRTGTNYAIGGRKGDAAYVVYAGPSGPGTTEVNLVTTGK
ncbi:hypothetical protein [Novosphingobium sp. MBES04]|uniref:hypothetical protein n=1 Tax=Novosphingobium sp. MBES04 TaxID=1206458 RepID=UPI000693C957|nr:hypothetical protein [Novosphingobium sp. MBES04]GAM04865.1 hypothetical conserved protein [Novosphingobium sp. MBES04]